MHRRIAAAVFTSVVALGPCACRFLSGGDPPNADLPAIQITATLPGASPETVAASVASPLEGQLSGVAGVRSMTSSSRMGETSILLQFDPKRDMDAATSEVVKAIQQAQRQLPPQVSPPVFRKINPADPPIVYIALTSARLTLGERTQFAQSMAQRISLVPHVGEVQFYGAAKPAVRVRLRPAWMAASGITLDQVEAAVNAATPNMDGRAIVVGVRNGSPVRLEDVAHVMSAFEDEKSACWFNGQRAVVLAVRRTHAAKASEITAAIRKLIPGFTREKSGAVEIHAVDYDPDSIAGLPEFPEGTSVFRMMESQHEAIDLLRQDPNVESVISVLDGPLYIGLKKGHAQKLEELITGLRPKLSQWPGIRVYLWNPSMARRSYTITANSIGELAERARKFQDKLARIAEVEDVSSDLQFGPEVTLRIDREKARAAGISEAALESASAIASGAHRILQLEGDTRDVLALTLAGKDNKPVRVDAVAGLAVRTGPVAVNHSGRLPSATFCFRVRPGVDVNKVLAELKEK
jgi:multidrug efflux pump subunit AcrB